MITPRPLVAVAHGSRRPAAQACVRDLLAAVRAARAGLAVREAYVELAAPSLPEVLRAVPEEPVVVPLLLGAGYHIAHDVAGVAAAHAPGRRGAGPPCAPALGPDPLLVDALADRLGQAESVTSPGRRGTGPVVLAAAGSSDPRSHAGAEATARMLATRLGREVAVAYSGAGRPPVGDLVARLRARGHRRISVATYLLAPGRFATALHDCGADVVSDPLGAHPAVARLVLRRYDAVVALSAASGRPAAMGGRCPAATGARTRASR